MKNKAIKKERELVKFWNDHTWVGKYPDAQWVNNEVLERVNLVVPDTADDTFVLKMVRSGVFNEPDEVYFVEGKGEEE